MNPSIQLDTRLTPGLTARLRQAVRLLQLSSLDYEQELQGIASKNPFIEIESRTEELSTLPQAFESWTTDAAGSVDDAAPPSDAATPLVGSGEDRPADADSWLQLPAGQRDGHDAISSAVDAMAAEIDLRQHLQSQARLLRLSARDHALVCAIIESLDDDGYLRTSLDEIAHWVGGVEGEPALTGELGTALKLVQSFEPSGVAARSIAECLRLQLDKTVPEQHAQACAILDGHLDRLARRDTAGIARALGLPLGRTEELCALIRRLDPRPASRFDPRRAHYIVPDVIVRKTRGRWDVQLNPAAMPRLSINQRYAEMFQQHRGRSHRELAAHLQEARWTVRNVDQRFQTILAVARSILKRQYGYFEHGPLAMKPLALAEIAAEIGVHESTVCRVTNNKYMATPAGVIELKSFFSRPMSLASGGASSGVAIRELVREMIAEEDGAAALSDGDIARRLSRQGVTITRRTVTKYRTLLQLPPAEQRRRAHAGSLAA